MRTQRLMPNAIKQPAMTGVTHIVGPIATGSRMMSQVRRRACDRPPASFFISSWTLPFDRTLMRGRARVVIFWLSTCLRARVFYVWGPVAIGSRVISQTVTQN